MFNLENQNSGARAGILETNHGKVKTPFFMPIATKGSVKQLNPEEVKDLGTEAIIANAFVLSLKPGLEVIEKFRGIHNFMRFDKTIFTDSGGFQILSKTFLHKSNEKGVYFINPFTRKKQFYAPEDIMKIGEIIRSDVVMALDFVPHYDKDESYIMECTRKTHLWAERCLKNYNRDNGQLLFGICQGGTFKELREKSAKFINDLNFDGVALGGLGIGEGRDLMFNAIKFSVPFIDKNKPRYLMGVGSPEDLLECIQLGIDCFDSRYPTMNSRHGGIFTSEGKIDITKVKFNKDENPLDESCKCYVCKNFSRSFIHHLYKTHESISDRYGNIHNLFFIQTLMKQSRKAILENRFLEFKKEFYENYKFNDKKNSKFSYN